MLDERRLPGRQGRLLFAYLVTANGRPVPRDELAEVLWGDAVPVTWDKALSVLVSKLRKVLFDAGMDGGRVLSAAFGCYRLELPAGTWVDVPRAEAAVQEAEGSGSRPTAWREAMEAAAFAESVVRLPFLPGDDGPWIDAKRRELADVRVRALSVLSESSLRSGEAAPAAHWAEQEVELEPFRETGYRQSDGGADCRRQPSRSPAGVRAVPGAAHRGARRLPVAGDGVDVPRSAGKRPHRVETSRRRHRRRPRLPDPRPRLMTLVGAAVVVAVAAAAAAIVTRE